MKTVLKLLEIAASEIGYKEKKTNDQLDDLSANAGDANYTKYARDLAAAGYYQASKQGYAWCDMFVDWCFLQLCGSKEKAEDMICQTGLYGAGCDWSARYYQDQGRFYTSDPQPGDQIFFNNYSHTGIIEKINGITITTIEGNTSNQVARRTYVIGSSYIDGFGRPKYESVKNPVETVENMEIGDVVNFTGSRHYISANSGTGSSCKPGQAKITNKLPGSVHPYHLVKVAGGGSTVYGWVDEKDIAALKQEAAPEKPVDPCNMALPTLKNGSTGATVKAIQILLIGFGHSCGSDGADGKFGAKTETAVKGFQKKNGLTADGICGINTWKKLLGL